MEWSVSRAGRYNGILVIPRGMGIRRYVYRLNFSETILSFSVLLQFYRV